jgi:hypothetical protein
MARASSVLKGAILSWTRASSAITAGGSTSGLQARRGGRPVGALAAWLLKAAITGCCQQTNKLAGKIQ